MTEKAFFDEFEKNRWEFTVTDGDNLDHTVLKVGLTASFQMANGFLPEQRWRIAKAIELFCDQYGEHLKWGYTETETLQEHDYSAQQRQATAQYLQNDGFSEPAAFRWASIKGYDQVPDYMIDGYSPAGWFEAVHKTLTTVRFYLPVEELRDGGAQRFESLLIKLLDTLAPLHAAAGLGIQHTYQWEDFQHVEYEIAMAYSGLDVVRPRGNPGWQLGYSNLNWFTYINDLWIKKLGTQAHLLAQLDDSRVAITALQHGTLFRAGLWPALGDVKVDPRPELYTQVNRVLKPLRVSDVGALHYGSIAGEPRLNHFISNLWLRRFDLPSRQDYPQAPAQYRRARQ